MEYPLDLRFRLISLGPQINVLDAGGRAGERRGEQDDADLENRSGLWHLRRLRDR